MAEQTSRLPILPTELWIRVLENHRTDENLPELWNTVRHVSTSFKEAVESIFRDSLLPKTWINFDLGEMYNEETDCVILSCEFEFSHLSEDKVTAVFKMDEEAEEHHDEIRDRLRAYGKGMSIEEPLHTVQVRYDISDSPIPNVSFDYEKFQLSCNWCELYTIFYGEIYLSNTLNKEWVKSQEGWATGLKEKMERGQLDMTAMLEQIMTGFVSGNEDNVKRARRARIKHQMQQLGELNWDPEINGDLAAERKALEILGKKREFIELQDLSDSEEAEEDDEESEEEWEDEEEDDE